MNVQARNVNETAYVGDKNKAAGAVWKQGEEGKIEREKLAVTKKHYDDWRAVQEDATQKSVDTMNKAEKQQQTQLVSAALRDVDTLIKDPANAMNPGILAQYQEERRRINARLYELTGIKGTPTAAAGPRAKPLSAFGG
jgi:hypothetical protein